MLIKIKRSYKTVKPLIGLEMASQKLQSAMEYLMTYGWAVLVISLAIGALFQIGVFNTGSILVKAPPGACEVIRPSGFQTVSNINLEGMCNGELPTYVEGFNYTGSFVPAGNSNVTIPSVPLPPIGNGNPGQLTATGWVYVSPTANTITPFAYGNFTSPQPPYNGTYLDVAEPGFCNDGIFIAYYYSNLCVYNNPVPPDKWIFVAMEYNGSAMIGYAIIDRQLYTSNLTTVGAYIPPDSNFLISVPLRGYMSNVQLYNKSLSENELLILYKEGIGGAPIDLQNLVGWWPLNGNANDYSGNYDDGMTSNTIYDEMWSNSYPTP